MTIYIRYPKIGDVTGPATSITDDIAVFDSTDGSSIADSGYSIASLIASITLQQAYLNSPFANPQILTDDNGVNFTIRMSDTSSMTAPLMSFEGGVNSLDGGTGNDMNTSGGSVTGNGSNGGSINDSGGDALGKNCISGHVYHSSGEATDTGGISGYNKDQTGAADHASGDLYRISGPANTTDGSSGSHEDSTGIAASTGGFSRISGNAANGSSGGFADQTGTGTDGSGSFNRTIGDSSAGDAGSFIDTGGAGSTGVKSSWIVQNMGDVSFTCADFYFRTTSSGSRAHFITSGLTGDRNYTWPDASGTVALTSTMTLQTTYNNSTSAPNITLADSNFQIVFPTTTSQRTILIGYDGTHLGTGGTASGITIRGQDADPTVGENGGPILIQAGQGQDVGSGGSVTLTAGGGISVGGDINLNPGSGLSGGKIKCPNGKIAIADGSGGYVTISNAPALIPSNYNVNLPGSACTIAGLSISGQSFTQLVNFAANLSLGTGLGGVTTLNSGATGTNKTITLFNLTGTVATIGNLAQTFSGQVTFSNATQASFSGSGGVSISGGSLTTSKALVSTISTGTAPFTITSTTKVTNLNVDKVDGLDVTTSGAGVPDMSQANSWSGVQSHDADVKFTTVGKGLYFKEGTNGVMGTGTLTAGTVTISTTKVTASSRIFLTDAGGGANIGSLSVGTVTAATSFVVNSSNPLDTSSFNWIIFEPA